MTYETALPDENQETVLPKVEVGTKDPNQPNGREVEAIKDEDNGTIKGEKDKEDYAVPGLPHYGCGSAKDIGM